MENPKFGIDLTKTKIIKEKDGFFTFENGFTATELGWSDGEGIILSKIGDKPKNFDLMDTRTKKLPFFCQFYLLTIKRLMNIRLTITAKIE